MLMRVLLLICTFVLHLTPSWGTGARWFEECEIQPGFQSPYLFPHFERFAVGKGCLSTETTANGAQVHIINLRRGPPQIASSEGNKVVLNIQPYIQTDWHRGQLIFVLNSRRPTQWQIQTDHIDNSSRHLFMICEECRVVKDGNIRIKIKKLNLSHTLEELVAWGRERYGNVTSITELDQANTITKKINSGDVDAAAVCEVKENFYTPTTAAVFLVPQQLSGCACPANEGLFNRDVHIIELHRGSSSSDLLNPTRVQQVVLDIKTRVKARGNQYLLLILKAHKRVLWKLRTHGIRGQMDVITDEKVDTEEALVQSVRVAIERLGNYEGRSLIQWAQEQYGPTASYSNIQLANHISLYTDGADGIKALAVPREGGTPHQGVRDDAPARGSSGPLDSPRKTRDALTQARVVNCREQGMTVTVRKSTARMYGVRKGHLSLMDSSCAASSNATHFILTTSLTECNTQQLKYPDRVVFKNAIMVHPLDDDEDDAEDQTGPRRTAPKRDEGSGVMGDDTFFDDEDYREQTEPIRVSFECEYRTPGLPAKPTDTTSSEKYRLEIYSDASYTNRFTNYPKRISVGESIYVEAKVESEEAQLDVQIHSCWISTTGDEERHKLIQQGCNFDRSIQWQNQNINVALSRGFRGQRFSFVYSTYFDNSFMNIIKCELSACSKDGVYNFPHVKKCMSKDQYCVNQSMSDSEEPDNIQTVQVGPFMVILPDDNSPFGAGGRLGLTPDRFGSTQSPNSVPKDAAAVVSEKTPCQQVVHVEGLDSATVVGIAFAAFIIGVLLTAALWFIHTHTGPIRRQHPPRSTETSGESTPSSTAPITIHQIHT